MLTDTEIKRLMTNWQGLSESWWQRASFGVMEPFALFCRPWYSLPVELRKNCLPQFPTVESGFEEVSPMQFAFLANFHPRINFNINNWLEFKKNLWKIKFLINQSIISQRKCLLVAHDCLHRYGTESFQACFWHKWHQCQNSGYR